MPQAPAFEAADFRYGRLHGRSSLASACPRQSLDARRPGCHSTLMEQVQSKPAQGRVADAPSGHWVYRALPRSAVALCATGALGPADRLAAFALALLVVGGAGGERLCAAGRQFCLADAFAVASGALPSGRGGDARRRLHLQRYRRRRHRREGRAHPFAAAALGPGDQAPGMGLPRAAGAGRACRARPVQQLRHRARRLPR